MIQLPQNALILITGGWGYLGTCVAQRLLEDGYRVRVLDPSPLGAQLVRAMPHHQGRLEWLALDLCHHDSEPDLLDDVRAIIHLGELANSDTCDAFPDHAVRINHHGSLSLARRARLSGVEHFLYVSTSSMYTESGERVVHELSPIEPKNLFSQLKAMTEIGLLALSGAEFAVTILRFGSLFGLSPRMRFDLVANRMMQEAWRSRLITVHGSGKQIRPFMHVEDAALAIQKVLEKDPAITRSQIFNVGRDDFNYRLGDLAADVSAFFLGTKIVHRPDIKDLRQYRVSFDKFQSRIGVTFSRSMRESLMEIAESLERHVFPNADDGRYFNLDFYKSQSRFLYGALQAARAPLWEPHLDVSRQIPINKPFLIDKSSDFRKRWSNKPRIIGVMVARNQASDLPRWASSLGRDLIDEVILVDDGSKDATATVARHLGLKVLRHETPQGYGACLKVGMKKALDRGADYVLEMGDVSALMTVEALEPSLSHMKSGADVILGSRLRDPYHALVKGMPFVRYLMHLFGSPLASWVLGREMTDLRPPVRLFSALFLRHVPLERRPAEDGLFPLRVLLQAAHLGAQWAEFPVYSSGRGDRARNENDFSLPASITSGPSWLQWAREILAFVLAQTGIRASRAFPIKKGRLPEFWTDEPQETEEGSGPSPSGGQRTDTKSQVRQAGEASEGTSEEPFERAPDKAS